jgi:hypothetical protein
MFGLPITMQDTWNMHFRVELPHLSEMQDGLQQGTTQRPCGMRQADKASRRLGVAHAGLAGCQLHWLAGRCRAFG